MFAHQKLRQPITALLALLLLSSGLLAADKTIKATLIKVDVKKVLSVKTDDGKKDFVANTSTKFIGPRGGVSDAGIKDDRLKPGAALTLVVAGNNKTLREVRLPERSGQ